MQVKLLVESGNMKPGPALGQKLGPLGININEIIKKVNDATKNFHGLKVPVELDINPSTKSIDVNVFSPPVSELLKKELGIEKGSGTQKKIKIANASIEQIISIAKTKFPNMLSKDLKSAVRTVVGTCGTLGILIENKEAKDFQKDINEGKYDEEIREGKTETSKDKKAKLDKYFLEIKVEQEKLIKKEEEEAKVSETTIEKEGEEPKGEIKAGEEKKEVKEEIKETKKKKK